MNKTELIASIATKADVSKEAASRMLNAFIETVADTNAKGDIVALVGFGTFKASKRAARDCRNPKTGETIKVPACVAPRFTAGAAYKAALNSK